MPSTQHLVQKHQQFLSEVKRREEKVKTEAPRAKLRDSFILDSDEAPPTACLPSHAQAVSLKSIIQKHEDIATNGKSVRCEVESSKTVSSCQGTMSSDGNLSITKHIVHGELRGKDGKEPTGRITSTEYSYRSSDDGSQRPRITSTTTTTHLAPSHLTSSGEVKIEELKESSSRRDSLVSSARKSLETRQREESEQLHQTEQRKSVVRGDSVKALQHKFQQPTVSSSMKRISGEEVRRSSVEERRSSVKEETKMTSKSSVISTKDSSTVREGSKSVTSFLDDSSKVTGVQDILQRMRNADLVAESSDTTEDAEARSLLNKFLGASVILQGMEAGGTGPASSALVSQVERQRILTSTQRKTEDIDEITDEKQLQILLEACSDYEQRRKIRARLRKIMADRKGVEGELVGGEEREDRREGELVGRWVEDSGTESGEERKGVEEAVEEVKGALERLASALPRLAGNLGGSVNDLVHKLQNCLNIPAPPPRKNKRRHHTVGVTPEEIAKARKWADKNRALQLIRAEFKPLEHKAAFFMEPQPQNATVSYNSPPLNSAPPINYDPSAALFTPAQSVQIAVHKAAIQKQISQEETKVRRASLQRQMSQEDLRKKTEESESSSEEEISPARRLLQIASKRRTRISKIKRSNTVEIPHPATYCDSDTDDPAYSSDRSDLKRKSCGGLYAEPPPFLPKTENDIKFLDFLSKVNDGTNKVISYNPLARGGKHWSNRFSRIKTSFEDQSSADEKEVVPKGKCSPFPQQKNVFQQKLPWSVKQEGDVVVGSITVAKKAPGPVNQFTHAPLSPFKLVEKKSFPSSVSGSVKQLATQKFTPTSEPEMPKPAPSIPPKTGPKFQPPSVPEASPLSSRFVPNKVSGVQQNPPVQAYLNQFANYTPKHLTSNEKPFKTPEKTVEKSKQAKKVNPNKLNHPVNISSNFTSGQGEKDISEWKTYHHQPSAFKPEVPAKPSFTYNRPAEAQIKAPLNHTIKQSSLKSQHNQSQPITDLKQHSQTQFLSNTQQKSINPIVPPKSDSTLSNKSIPTLPKYQTSSNQLSKQDLSSQIIDPEQKPFIKYPKPTEPSGNSLSNLSSLASNGSKPFTSYQPMNNFSSNNALYQREDNMVRQTSPKHKMPECQVRVEEPISPKYPDTLENSDWTRVDNTDSANRLLTVLNNERDSESVSPHPYKGCYVYNENNEIISTSPYLPPTSGVNYHLPVSPSYREPIYQNLSEVQNSKYSHNLDLSYNHLPSNAGKMPDKSPSPHNFQESGTFYPTDHISNSDHVIYEPIHSHSAVSQQRSSPSAANIPHYYPQSDRSSYDSLNKSFSPEYSVKNSPYVVYNNCPMRKDSNNSLERFSPGVGLFSSASGGNSPRGSEEWDDCVEEKAVVGRVMGEAQQQRAVTQSRRVESRFPNAPPRPNLLRAPPDQTNAPSPTSKSRQDVSPNPTSPSFPNVLHKSESWHQMVKGQMIQAKQAPPLPLKVSKTKSSHSLALPKQFEGSLDPESARRLQSTVSSYMSKSPSSQRPLTKTNSLGSRPEDIENVDEAFESLFQECSKKRNSK